MAEKARTKKLERQIREQAHDDNNAMDTPTKEAATILCNMGVTPTKEKVSTLKPVFVALESVKKAPKAVKKTLFGQQQYRQGNAKYLSKKIGMSRDNIFHSKRAKSQRRNLLSKAKQAQANEFLRRSDNSYELPAKKDQLKGSGRFTLVDTMRNLHKKFCAEFPEARISFSVFCAGRSPFIKSINYGQRIMCLCQTHANVHLMATASKVLPKSPSAICSMANAEVKAKLEDSLVPKI